MAACLVLFATFACALLASCSRGSEPARAHDSTTTATAPAAPPTSVDRRSTSTSTSSTTILASAEERAAARAYLEIMRRYYLRLQHPDPRDPDILKFHVAGSRGAVQDRAQDLAVHHQAFEFTSVGVPVPRVVSVARFGSGWRIRNCVVDDVRVVDARTRAVANDDVVAFLLESTIVPVADHWALGDQHLVEKWDGTRRCLR